MATIDERITRALSIFRHLQRAPANRELLLDLVFVDVGGGPYDSDTKDAGRRRFEEDLGFVHKGLSANRPRYDRGRDVYEFQGFGAFRPLGFSDEELDTLAFLSEAFGPDAPHGDQVQALLHRIGEMLPDNQQDALLLRRNRMQIRLRRKDTDEVDPIVENALNRALRRQVLRFAYISPSQADEIPRIHTVEPWNRFFDLTRGHFYLDAFMREVDGPHGLWKARQWMRYRIGRILADGIQVLPERLPPSPPIRPRHKLDYLLAPEIARLGQVSRHFDDMEVLPPDNEGWVRVTATTDNLFMACRQLLSYGPSCRVVGEREARQHMEALVEGLGRMYNDNQQNS
ncbi:MAG: WYL domain-containing protein [Caldilineaceae bacterium]|nr:WYL domain-containing protein [Caldilineaceae bacterium]